MGFEKVLLNNKSTFATLNFNLKETFPKNNNKNILWRHNTAQNAKLLHKKISNKLQIHKM